MNTGRHNRSDKPLFWFIMVMENEWEKICGVNHIIDHSFPLISQRPRFVVDRRTDNLY